MKCEKDGVRMTSEKRGPNPSLSVHTAREGRAAEIMKPSGFLAMLNRLCWHCISATECFSESVHLKKIWTIKSMKERGMRMHRQEDET